MRLNAFQTTHFYDGFRAALNRGWTFRTFPGGKRAMFHRWHYTKIKGSRPLRELIVKNITTKNPLLDKLMQRG
jgi:hypothetical protein